MPALASESITRVPSKRVWSTKLQRGRADVFEHAGDVDTGLWADTFGDSHKDFEYYRLIEDTMREHFAYRYLVLSDHDDRAYGLQPLVVVDQDLTASSGGLAGLVRRLRGIAPRFLKARMLIAGCLVGDGRFGILAQIHSDEAVMQLSEALVAYAKSQRIRFITVKDFPVACRKELACLTSNGFTRLGGYPSLRLELTFQSFEQYMDDRLSKITRKGLRRKLRKAANAQPSITMEVLEDCTEVIDEIYPLYCRVAERSDVTFEIFTREYFLEAGLRMPGRFRYFIWRQYGKAVAFSFCTIWNDSIYDNDIGLDYSVAHELNLYHVTFRDLIEWALAHGLKSYHSAPFNYDAKLHLRMQLEPVDLYVRHTSSPVNFAIKHVAPFFAPAKSDSVLRRHLLD
jgi:hypothetical protein